MFRKSLLGLVLLVMVTFTAQAKKDGYYPFALSWNQGPEIWRLL